MTKRLKTISPERAVHIIDGLMLWWFGEYFGDAEIKRKHINKEFLEKLNQLLSDINDIAHVATKPSCISAHQNSIPKIKEIEKSMIKLGFSTPFNKRSWKTQLKERRKNRKDIFNG